MLGYTHPSYPVHAGIHTPPLAQCMLGYTPPHPVHAGIHTPPLAQCMLGYTHPHRVHAGIHTPLPSACWDTCFPRVVTAVDRTHAFLYYDIIVLKTRMHSSRMRTTCFSGRPSPQPCHAWPPPTTHTTLRASPPPRGQTDTCENITFPQLLSRAVIMRHLLG